MATLRRSCSQQVAGALTTPRRLPAILKGLFFTDWNQFDIILRLKDPLAKSEEQAVDLNSKKKKRFANLAFDSDSVQRCDSLLGGLLQQAKATDVPLQLASKKLHLSPSAPETAAVLDGLLLRALGSKACVRRYLFLRFLRRICQAFPDALVVGFDSAQAQQLAGGLPAVVALKIPPSALLCRALQPSAASPRLLFCPSSKRKSQLPESHRQKRLEGNFTSAPDLESLMAVLSPSMLLGGIASIGAGLVQDIQLT